LKSGRFYLSYIVSKLWMSLAVLTVSLALVISVLRYSLPYMHSQKDYIEQWLFDNYGAEVEIGYISAIWKGRGPAIVLKDLTLVANDLSPISFSVDETQVELDIISSIQNGNIHSRRFNLIGMDMQADLVRIQQGEASNNNFPVVDALQTLFLEQLKRFSVSDSTVTIKTELDEQQIQIQQLSWLNQGTRHQGVGEMRVDELARNSARFVLDLTGKKNDVRGTFYAEAQDLDIAPWMKQYLPTQYDLVTSRANFQLWAGLDNSAVTSVQATFADSRVMWENSSAHNTKTIDPSANSAGVDNVSADIVRGDFTAVPKGNGWQFNVNDLLLLIDKKATQSDWSGEYLQGRLTLNNHDSIDLSPLLPLVGVITGAENGAQLAQLAPKLQLDALQLELSQQQTALAVTFSQLQFAESVSIGLPGVNGLSGRIHWLDSLAKIELFGSDSELRSGQLLGYNIPYHNFALTAYFDAAGEQAGIYVPQFELSGDKVSVDGALHYDMESEQLQLITRLGDVNVAQAKTLFPRDLMGPDTTAFLKRTLHQGDVQDLQLIWSGVPAQFPYAENQGIFQANIGLRNGHFEFDESWPKVTEMDVDLLFENESLLMDSEHARILDVVVKGVKAEIPTLEENSQVNIALAGNTTGTLATGLMQASSLQDSVGSALDVVQISGPLGLKLKLVVPLTGENIQAIGEVSLTNNPVYIPNLDLPLTNVSGVLQFQNENIQAQQLSAQLYGQPLEISASALQGRDAYQADIDIDANWNVDTLLRDYHPGLQPYLQGKSDWHADLALNFPEQGFSYSLQATSQLNGVILALPDPLEKPANENQLLFIDSEGDTNTSTVRILLGDSVKFNGILPHADAQFSRAHLTMGEDNFVGMGIGFSIHAHVPQFEFTPWYHFIEDFIGGIPNSDNPLLKPPERVFIDTDNFVFLNQPFTGVNIQARNRDDDWQVKVNANQIRADVLLGKALSVDGIEVDADFINLAEWHEEDEADEDRDEDEQETDYSALPPIKFRCASCQLENYQFGEVAVDLSRRSTGMHIDLFRLVKKEGVIVATGDWFIDEDDSSTRLQGTFRSKDFGDFLKDLEFDSGIRDSDADMDFDLSWNDEPFDMSFDSLNGTVQWQLGDGYMTEVSDNGARIFSFLSLNSLLRKLTLDFRDVFAKGFFYEKMQGTFDINEGRLKTDDARIEGAAARVDIRGSTDLSDKRLNYEVLVKPNLTASLPVLLAWMVNPATAVAALAFDEVITSANVVSDIKYSLTGTLSEPKVELLDKSSKSVELPAKQIDPVSNPNALPDVLPQPPQGPMDRIRDRRNFDSTYPDQTYPNQSSPEKSKSEQSDVPNLWRPESIPDIPQGTINAVDSNS